MHLQIKAVFLCGLLLLLRNINAQNCTSGTTLVPTNFDPHYFTLCSNGEELLKECPTSTLYVQVTDNLANCTAKYGGCSLTVTGCVPWQQFPWPEPPLPSPSMTAPACFSVGSIAPYADPSFYWFCTTVYGTAQLRACPSGYGFSTRRTFGCTRWDNWNTTWP